MTTVAELMNKGGLLYVAPSTTVAEAATMMGERRVGSALVMEGDALLGIFTERDIVKALGADFDAAKHQVAEWMTRNPTTVPPESPARDALKTMLDGGFRHLPVLEGDKVIGVVSMRDLSRLESEA
jgi:CBS domain-containing protein